MTASSSRPHLSAHGPAAVQKRRPTSRPEIPTMAATTVPACSGGADAEVEVGAVELAEIEVAEVEVAEIEEAEDVEDAEVEEAAAVEEEVVATKKLKEAEE